MNNDPENDPNRFEAENDSITGAGITNIRSRRNKAQLERSSSTLRPRLDTHGKSFKRPGAAKNLSYAMTAHPLAK